MSIKNAHGPTMFPTLDRVIPRQRRMTIMNTLVTFLFFGGVVAMAASSLGGMTFVCWSSQTAAIPEHGSVWTW